MTRLLVSVRSAAEAEIALAGGAGLIDVKEPYNGPLGMANVEVIADVLRVVAGRVPVSAALGEARDAGDIPSVAAELAFVKYGAAGCQGQERLLWSLAFFHARRRLVEIGSPCQVVVTAYADWQRARAPSPNQLCDFAREHRAGAFLLDTWGKDGSTLLDWLPLVEIEQLCRRCHEVAVPVALAGSLGPRQIYDVAVLFPDWIAVRGAACQDNRRESSIHLGKVRGLAQLIEGITSRDRQGALAPTLPDGRGS